jgi:hypothetical protein
MSAPALHNYYVPCLDEGIDVVSDFRYTVPTVCPHNDTHTIDAGGIRQWQTVVTKVVKIDQTNAVPNGGYFRCDQFELEVTGGTGATGFIDIGFDYPTGVFAVTFFPTAENVKDTYEVISYPDSPAGYILAPLATGATGLTIASAPLLNPGFEIYITDGINTDQLGHISSIGATAYSVAFTTGPTNAYSSTGMTGILFFGIPRLKGGKFVNTQNIPMGFSKIGSAGLAANKKVRVIYTNKTGEPKTIGFQAEIEF